KDGLYLGLLDANKDVKVFINTESLISKHVGVLAATGSGKSYTVGVILEELLEKKLPVVILDPHGEYVSLKFKNDNEKELESMETYGISPKAFNVVEYSPDPRLNPGSIAIKFAEQDINAADLAQIFPTKPTSSQMAILYTAIREAKEHKKGAYTLEDIMNFVTNSESASKWNVLNMLELIKELNLFSTTPTKLSDIVKPGQASIINLRGVAPEIQGIVAYKLIEQIFEKRKVGRIPPLFMIVEEAHNFCPEKEVRASSKIIRTVASEGRKFGMGLCIISQRPARVDKNVLSQCNTQIILKITNPNDLKAVSYAEGITSGIESEIKNLNPGTALILGQEMPLFVDIRTKKSKHGGVTVGVTEQPETEEMILTFLGVRLNDIKSKLGEDIKAIYYPCFRIKLSNKYYLIDAIKGKILYLSDNNIKESEVSMETSIAGKHFEPKPKLTPIDGDILNPKITQSKVETEIAPLLGTISEIKLVYYPYIIGKNFMIDGITGIKKDM
ncbi:MAG: ATP-binding protein, partial [Candidatus Aenigmarchaeota archaeon]|nr:ATP-binding protein [Candidatus Aenigmarchaeota archaeon]